MGGLLKNVTVLLDFKKDGKVGPATKKIKNTVDYLFWNDICPLQWTPNWAETLFLHCFVE